MADGAGVKAKNIAALVVKVGDQGRGFMQSLTQELMRHSDIRLTMNVYTHLHFIDTAGAVELLPTINSAPRCTPSGGAAG